MRKKLINTNIGSFEKNTLIVFALSLFANAMNALFQIFSGKLLGTAEYGLINVINSYVTYLGVFCGPIATMACCYCARLRNDGEQAVSRFVRWILKYSFMIEILISIVGICVAFIVKKIGGEEVFRTIFFVVLLLPSNSFYVILQSILQGKQKFMLHGVIGVIFYAIKAFLGVALIAAGWGSFGVVFAMFMSQMVCIAICMWDFRVDFCCTSVKHLYSGQDLLSFYGNIFLLQIFCFFYINGGEIIILNLFFENDMIGEYSAAAMLCKLLFYAVTPITTVLLPNVAEKKSQGLDTTAILKKALGYVSLLTGCFGLGVLFWGEKVISILYGSQYQNAGIYLLPAFLYTFAIILLSIMYSYHTAIDHTKKMTKAMLALTVLLGIAVLLKHNDLNRLLLTIGSLLGLIDVYAYVIAKD